MRGMGRVFLGVAALILATTVVVFGATFVKAFRVDGAATAQGGASGELETPGALPDQEPPPPPTVPGEEPASTREPEVQGPAPDFGSGIRQGRSYPRVTQDELLDAVNQDLFQPDRLPPLERYRFPSERVSAEEPRQESRRQRGPEIRIVGSAIMGDRAVALIQVDDSIPMAVLLGERVEGYVLASVDRESATLVGLEGPMTLPVVEPLSGGQSTTRGAAVQVDPRDMQRIQGAVQEMLRRQMTGEMGGRAFREGEIQLRRANPTNRGGRGGGGGRP